VAVEIRPLGSLKGYLGGRESATVEAGPSIREAVKALGIPPEIVAFVMVNDAQQPKDYRLRDGDVVELIAVIGGG
jgi:sulfur carrier protein ThiS